MTEKKLTRRICPCCGSAVYPATEADLAVCAAALSAVTQRGKISTLVLTDVLIIATHRKLCETFLDKPIPRAFKEACKAAPGGFFHDEGEPIHLQKCREYLEDSRRPPKRTR